MPGKTPQELGAASPRRADQKEIRFGVSSVVSPANAFAGRRQGRADDGDQILNTQPSFLDV